MAAERSGTGRARRPQRWVVLPPSGFRSPALDAATLRPGPAVRTLERLPGGRVRPELRVVAGIGADGPKLVEGSLEAVLSLRRSAPELVLVPEVWGRAARVERPAIARAALQAAAAATPALRLLVRDAASGRPLAGAEVLAFTDYAARAGDGGVSDADGEVRLGLTTGRIQRLLVYGPAGYWGLHRRDVELHDGDVFAVRPIDRAEGGLLPRRLAAALPVDAGSGVRVAILDTGVARDHPDLPVAFGRNCVNAEVMRDPAAAEDWGPAGPGGEHGTHVAGIVGARGAVRGVAPAAELVSYRVFAHDSNETSSFDVADAIDQAVGDECDILNLSLSFASPDDTVRRAIEEAIGRGVLVVAAAGNHGRRPVSFPASHQPVVAVAAAGDERSFPADAADALHLADPRGDPDAAWFAAAFTNKGPQIDLAGPGVALVSTVPGGYGVMSGTSMACPFVAGMAAWLLGADTGIRTMPRDSARSKALEKLLYERARPLGLGRVFEGFGLPGHHAVA